ncbi:MAG: hypothetical protein ACK4HQ_00365 [Brevinematales bacterium]
MKYVMVMSLFFVHLAWSSFMREVGVNFSPVFYSDFVSYGGSVQVFWWKAMTNLTFGNSLEYQGSAVDSLFLHHLSLLAGGRYQLPIGGNFLFMSQIDTGPGYTLGQITSFQKNLFHWFLDMKVGIRGSLFSLGKMPLFVNISCGYEMYWIPSLENLLIRGVSFSVAVSVVF